jgi:peptidoglycan/LPS O-acetylase OafA/YrhL
LNYRLDIDGLRAIAVTIVVLFHFGIPGFSGGFIGVDIFFVLSGYLIGSIIFNQLGQDAFSFTRFYFRRIRRLFPAFVVVIVVTTLFAYGIMLPNDFREYGQSVVASSIYLSNFLFYMEAGYFDTASHLKPLLHTWSLSVEEQFYIIFPFIAWFSYRYFSRWITVIVTLLLISSLLAAELYREYNASAVFYLYPFRAWEMFIGVLLATQCLPKPKSASLSLLLSIIGLLMILVPNVVYTDKTPFPGLSALIPCMGTCFLIYAGIGQTTVIQRLLSSSLAVFLGKISYSLYLWHWPIYVLYTYSLLGPATNIDIAVICLLTVVAAYLSWKFVETPCREGRLPLTKTSLSVFSSTAIISVLLIGVGFYIHKTNGVPQRLDGETAKFAEAANDLFGDLSGCEGFGNRIFPDLEYCTVGSPFDAPNFTLVWGDSHGGAYKRGLEKSFENPERSAVISWTGGCPPVFGIDKDESVSSRSIDKNCMRRNQFIEKMVTDNEKINSVILLGRWSYYLNGGGVGVDEHNKIAIWPEGELPTPTSNTEQAQFFVERLTETIRKLNQLGHKVFVVEQPPELSKFKARVIALGLMQNDSHMNNSFDNLTEESYVDVKERQGEIIPLLDSLEQQGLITVLRTHNLLCNDKTCSALLEGYPAYFDNNHVSSSGALKIHTMFDSVKDFLNNN